MTLIRKLRTLSFCLSLHTSSSPGSNGSANGTSVQSIRGRIEHADDSGSEPHGSDGVCLACGAAHMSVFAELNLYMPSEQMVGD